jgi:hypothetical protein
MYEAQFTARAERYSEHDRRTADARAASLLTALARPFRLRRRPLATRPSLRVVAGPADGRPEPARVACGS